jgi:hypothetical protein
MPTPFTGYRNASTCHIFDNRPLATPSACYMLMPNPAGWLIQRHPGNAEGIIQDRCECWRLPGDRTADRQELHRIVCDKT